MPSIRIVAIERGWQLLQRRRRNDGSRGPSGANGSHRAIPLMRRRLHQFWAAILLPVCFVAGWPASGQTLERIQATKVLRIGYVADQAPFSSSGAGGGPVGYGIDICGKIAQALEQRIPQVKIEYIPTTLAAAFAAVSDGNIDLLCGAITATLTRRESVDFSEPIFVTGASALLRADATRNLRELFMGDREISPPRSPEIHPFELDAVGVRSGTTTEVALRQAVAAGGYNVEIVSFATHAEGLAALESRRIDAYFADRVLLEELVAKSDDPTGFILGKRLFTREPYAVAMKRGDSDLRLLVDRALTQFYQTPEFSALLAKYFPTDRADIQAQILAQSLPE